MDEVINFFTPSHHDSRGFENGCLAPRHHEGRVFYSHDLDTHEHDPRATWLHNSNTQQHDPRVIFLNAFPSQDTALVFSFCKLKNKLSLRIIFDDQFHE